MALVEKVKPLIHPRNTLNELPTVDWLKATRSWFMMRPKGRGSKLSHPASFPEELVANYIQFFTKKNALVCDTFLGSGTTTQVARQLGRNAIGIELSKKYAKLSQERLDEIPENKTKQIIVNDDSRNLKKIFKKQGIPQIDFCITSPPYWNQLKNKGLKDTKDRATHREKLNLDVDYGDDSKDIGMIDEYDSFLDAQDEIFDSVYDLMKPKGYMLVVTNNVYKGGRLWPLAFDTVTRLSKKWVPKDEQIWCQDSRRLHPFGMFHSYIGNRAHHYCLVFRKESKI
jgi:DNA modification methylase